jgi:hypothetical protein
MIPNFIITQITKLDFASLIHFSIISKAITFVTIKNDSYNNQLSAEWGN